MAKRQSKIKTARGLMAAAAAAAEMRPAALRAFKKIRGAVVRSRKSLTRAIFDAYVDAYKVGAWYALPEDAIAGEQASATDMLKWAAGIPVDVPTSDKAVRKEINYSNNVRKWSDYAVEAGVGSKKKSGKAKPDAKKILKYLRDRLTVKALPPATVEPETMTALVKVVRDYGAEVSKAHAAAADRADRKAASKARRAGKAAAGKAAALKEADTRKPLSKVAAGKAAAARAAMRAEGAVAPAPPEGAVAAG